MPYSDSNKAREQRARWKNNNREKVRASSERWRRANLGKVRAAEKRRYYSNPERRRAQQRMYAYKRSYGMTIEDRDAMFKLQSGRCACCGVADPGVKLRTDHDHNTGRVRGLVCNGCNLAVGYIESARYRFVLAYLEKHKCVA